MYNYWAKGCIKIKDVSQAIHWNDVLVFMVSV